ncbi:MAG: hypothetical protein A3G59_02665 [Candidatus Taylorbacteria bacterium RIFCSPLOWO2_12_FULL_47_20]|uniref:Uncharacterized protein n=2 Tax=Candidatus Tayloriibacteriota TaxID=1817919 RepID=A0A1G2P7J0_9BACT|nr:MAG: hypothetical protein A3H68_01505 [Candidatus Taylorbacteria bacterium RIFCSPLOWO2_02_FULL_46_40]OHA44298.1 MAG: hypothetical protein A3G59_02665 [Candidatus Taylorbacteria bacterium RIFCSPLOWO2_12_FULL_47_20]
MTVKFNIDWGKLPPNQNLLINLVFKKRLQEDLNLRPETAMETINKAATMTGLSVKEVVEVMQPIFEQLVREYFAAVDMTEQGPPDETEPAPGGSGPSSQPPEMPLGFGTN